MMEAKIGISSNFLSKSCLISSLTVLIVLSQIAQIGGNTENSGADKSNATKYDTTSGKGDDIVDLHHMTVSPEMKLTFVNTGAAKPTPENYISSLGVVNDPGHPIRSRCKAFLDTFAESSANFTECAIKHSRPMKFCKGCVVEYETAKRHYKDIHVNCGNILFNADRIMVIQQIEKFMDDLWDTSSCDNCFVTHDFSNTSVVYKLSNGTLHFEQLYNETMTCMNATEDFVHQNASHQVCETCSSPYERMNTFYNELMKDNKNKMCMDIVDTMNYTRIRWSKTFNCTKQHMDAVPVICLTVFFCILPIVFYVGSKVHGVRKEKKIIKQKRMKNLQSSTASESLLS